MTFIKFMTTVFTMAYVTASSPTIISSQYFLAVISDRVLLILQNIGNYYTFLLMNGKVSSCEEGVTFTFFYYF